MYDPNTTLGQFLSTAAAKQPTPGGGSVAALAGALAASMGEMAVNYSIGKKGLEAHAEPLRLAVGEYQRARAMLIELMCEDQSAYEALTAAKKMTDSPAKTEAMGVAVLACIRIPQSIAATALVILDLAEKLTPRVNVYLLSDLAVCAELGMATVRCGIYNVRVNLPEISEIAQRRRIESECGEMLARATAIIQRTIPAIWARLKSVETKK